MPSFDEWFKHKRDLPWGMSGSDGWRAHELSQLRRFSALSLREKLEAVEGMADIVRCLQQMRQKGKFRSGALGRRV